MWNIGRSSQSPYIFLVSFSWIFCQPKKELGSFAFHAIYWYISCCSLYQFHTNQKQMWALYSSQNANNQGGNNQGSDHNQPPAKRARIATTTSNSMVSGDYQVGGFDVVSGMLCTPLNSMPLPSLLLSFYRAAPIFWIIIRVFFTPLWLFLRIPNQIYQFIITSDIDIKSQFIFC